MEGRVGAVRAQADAAGREGWLLPRKRGQSIKKCPDWPEGHPRRRGRSSWWLLIAAPPV